MSLVSIEHLRKVYWRDDREFEAIRDITLEVRSGEFISIVGPSGCGKTTLLSCISGLRSLTGGRVVVNGRVVNKPIREIALIFQDYGRTLLPWRSALGNVIFGMENRPEISRNEYEGRAREALRSVGLVGIEQSYPWQLSGGQQQRVAIARGIANGSEILLMDEPFASVDAQTRSELEDLMLKIWKELGKTVIFVTHDIDEAVYLSDRVAVLSKPPCAVLETLEIKLDRPRDQIATREQPQFLECRRSIHSLLHQRAGRTEEAQP
jgi:NitT/TauT family transport system ATP-binding protein